MKCYLSYLIGITLLCVHVIYTRSIQPLTTDESVNFTTNTTISNEDKYYLIYVNNQYGEYKIFSDTKIQKRQASQLFVESLVDEINTLIIENKDTYQNPEKLIEIEENSQLNNKRKRQQSQMEKYFTYSDSDFVYPISSVNDRVVLFAYLSTALSQKIAHLNENIIAITPNRRSLTLHHSNYNVDDILSETGWKDVTVRENADFHLSLISQGKFNETLVNQYDTNYYYPSSAGKDVDIVILDSSFHFDYSEFSNKEDRTVKCAGNVVNGKVSLDNIDQFCGSSELYHGETVANVAAGLVHGVANRANVFGVSLPVDENGELEESDIMGGMQFIYETMVRPHHTVINLSLGGPAFDINEFYNHYQELVKGIHEKGGLIVSSSGNNSANMKYLPYPVIPCDFKEVICVGGFNNTSTKDFSNLYRIARQSNHSREVDIYAPFHVTAEILKDGKVEKVNKKGTSFSSPIVAGMVANILSENFDIHYTKDSMTEVLVENGKTETISLNNGRNYYNGIGLMANNGKHIVYSEDGIYHGCGIYAGNQPCDEN